jgi:type IV pilus assembly protein PilA
MKRMSKKSRKGFTLIELIIVILILAVLAAIAIPAYNQYRKTANIAANEATAKVIYDAILASDASGIATPESNYTTLVGPITGTPTVTGTVAAGTLKVSVSNNGEVGVYPPSS